MIRFAMQGEASGHVAPWVEGAALLIEILAVLVIVVPVLVGFVPFLYALVFRRATAPEAYRRYKAVLGRWLLLGLEILVAADVIRTVALEPTLENVAALGLLVLVRTFLGWAIVVELEGHWPWRPGRTPEASEE
jgi:uncharacterized membrane protein